MGTYALHLMPSHRRGTTGKDPEWPIDEEWIARVNEWCEREGRGAKARLAKGAGIEPGTRRGSSMSNWRRR